MQVSQWSWTSVLSLWYIWNTVKRTLILYKDPDLNFSNYNNIFRFTYSCPHCEFVEDTDCESVLPSLPAVVKDFNIIHPVHKKKCLNCSYTKGKRKMIYKRSVLYSTYCSRQLLKRIWFLALLLRAVPGKKCRIHHHFHYRHFKSPLEHSSLRFLLTSFGVAVP